MKNLIKYGLNDSILKELELYPSFVLAKVVEQHTNLYKVISEYGESLAKISGKFLHSIYNNDEFPTVGDWVLLDKSNNTDQLTIQHILKRKSVLKRNSSGVTNKNQVIAANIDYIFICMSLNSDFNLRRLERYLTAAWNSMAIPIVILTKSDLCDDIDSHLSSIKEIALGVDILVSSILDDNYGNILSFLSSGKTGAFIGSSGVGKSTLINSLMNNNVLRTKDIRNDGKGRHTTTHRQLFLLPNGGIVIDTPGMREFQLESGNVSASFEDIEQLSEKCKFRDCSHSDEPNCNVKKAIQDGHLSQSRLESYRKLKVELSYSELNSRKIEQEKINRMFGSKGKYKKIIRQIKKSKK